MNRLFSLKLSRSLIRCVGGNTETTQFLQGMITNDMNHLSNKSSCIYAHFLNKAGRVLYDTIIYKTQSQDKDKESFLIECDSTVANSLAKHLKLYRVRRRIDVTVSDEHELWCLLGCNENLVTSSDVSIHIDPRLKDLGYRIIAANGQNIKEAFNGDIQEGMVEDYTKYRYGLGICEGTIDLIPEKSFPLESNCDYMHGISFHKGCYIGQELTARTHHTGVIRKRLMPLFIRKRLMPLFFDKPINFKSDEPVEVKNEENKSVGKVRNVIGETGLGLMRIDQALSAIQLSLNENRCRTEKPTWWPIEAEKTSRLTKT